LAHQVLASRFFSSWRLFGKHQEASSQSCICVEQERSQFHFSTCSLTVPTKEESIKNKALPDLPRICLPLEDAIKEVLPSQPQPTAFLDGPKHDDKVNTFQSNFEHLCTSVGYPQPKNEDRNKIFVWALDVWSEKEMIQALCLFYGQAKKEAREIYHICGGCMRDAASAVTKEGKAVVMENLNTTVSELRDADIRVAMRQTINQDVSQNRLQTITVFNKKHKRLTDVNHLLHKVD
jgi:hypothetical protein